MRSEIVIPVVLSIVLIAVLLLRRMSSRSLANADLASQWRQVDLASMANLLDPLEERYLRLNLSAADFKVIYRERIAVAWEYFSNVAHNSKLMVRAGQAMLHAKGGAEVNDIRALVRASSALRLTLLQAQTRLAFSYAFPSAEANVAAVVESYGALAQRMQMAVSMATPASSQNG